MFKTRNEKLAVLVVNNQMSTSIITTCSGHKELNEILNSPNDGRNFSTSIIIGVIRNSIIIIIRTSYRRRRRRERRKEPKFIRKILRRRKIFQVFLREVVDIFREATTKSGSDAWSVEHSRRSFQAIVEREFPIHISESLVSQCGCWRWWIFPYFFCSSYLVNFIMCQSQRQMRNLLLPDQIDRSEIKDDLIESRADGCKFHASF